MVRIAVDAMGGDFAPSAIVEGAIRAVRAHVCDVTLVGPEAEIRAELQRLAGADPWPEIPEIDVVDAPDRIEMAEAPIAALRKKPRASIRVATELVAHGRAAAVLSAGHTGATLVSAHAVLGVLSGVERPALAVTIPTRTGAAVLVDAGANVDCVPSHLVQFAIMGTAFARVALGVAAPKIGLLSIGEEPGKGNDLVKETHALLRGSATGYIGNIDARQLFAGTADVIVCDGFTGNIALKVGEGLVEWLAEMLQAERRADLSARLQYGLNYAAHGAAPLLGVNGLVLVGHGRSSAEAVHSGLVAAARLSTSQLTARLADALAGPRAVC
jgi:glycerol-3-phosphate acyltransferase PlsX